MLNDHEQRLQAIDITRSFIVQAPAGSGKTELLTQRYLRLLSTVDEPEQIIALTFTRKAANEMRERILFALQKTAQGVEATSQHQQATFIDAARALKRDTQLNWQLLQQPNRLRIITIDALCQMLTHAIPLQEKQIHYAQVSETPLVHYQSAANACLQFALQHQAYHQPLKQLLSHLDNRQDLLLTLFAELLAKRDQWLSPFYQAKNQDKITFEHALEIIIQHELARFKQTLHPDDAHMLINLASRLACIENNPQSPRYLLRDWVSLDSLDDYLAKSLAALLLTTQNTLRKSFDHHVGLKRGVCDDNEYDEIKNASKMLLEKLETLPDFLDALLSIKHLPKAEYDNEQWEVLQALFSLLPMLLAHLQLIFAAKNEVDFTAISQQALQALGDELAPTDLALYLDHRIHHLLVDEFQDTSLSQFQLLTHLVHGWQPHDGKTLFVVGDPMQSIYRFRSAEVGLFLRAARQGIGPVNLIPLELTCNFRSTANIVEWVNTQFQTIFPTIDDIEAGAISFSSSTHIKPSQEDSYIKAYQAHDCRQEADILVKCVQEELIHYPNDTLAILVRSRKQLSSIMGALREQGISFQGIDIDLLANLPHLRDLWSLTQALLMPANRLAWLALLRSPWCGLTLVDLNQIANYAPKKSIYFALAKLDQITQLTDDGRMRAQYIFTVLHNALMHRHQQSLVQWLLNTVKNLHLEHILDETQQNDLDQYWFLLERFENNGLIGDLALFEREFGKLYSQKVTPSQLQIMTIHKSKGLEFDCVFLPGLSARSTTMDTPLLRWLKLPLPEQGELSLLSPMRASHQEQCALYDYLGKLDAQKNHYELQRLLYVATTRSKKRLYLFDHNLKSSQGTFRHLLQQQMFTETEPADPLFVDKSPLPILSRLPIDYYRQLPIYPQVRPSSLGVGSSIPRLTGIVVHELLQWICDHHPTSITDIPWQLADQSLLASGLSGTALEVSQEKIREQLTHFFQDPIGQWIMQAHTDEHNEYELLVESQGEIVTRIIDRTFYAKNTRWIIDFKTGQEDLNTTLHHRQQLNAYATYLTQRFEEPIRCGVYYLANQHWIDWDYTHSTSRSLDKAQI
jgi:ATP-dependent helicase/nuclease subunit A